MQLVQVVGEQAAVAGGGVGVDVDQQWQDAAIPMPIAIESTHIQPRTQQTVQASLITPESTD
eukprot:scaffold5957_cov32-Tisochrysis_lutea.AAC.2